MGFFDFFKSKPKAEIEILANDFIQKVESGTESEAKNKASEILSKIKDDPSSIMEVAGYSVVGKALFIIQFMGVGGSTLSKTAIANMSYYCLCKAIQLGNKKTDSARTLLNLMLQGHSNLEGTIRNAISKHNRTTDKEVKESLTKIVYYLMKSCPGSSSGNEPAQMMKMSMDSMILQGRFGAGSTSSSVQAEGQKYFDWLRVHLEELIGDGRIVRL
jgi:hypothetical protein